MLRPALNRAASRRVLCHVLLLARFHDVDIEAEIEAKWLRLGREPLG